MDMFLFFEIEWFIMNDIPQKIQNKTNDNQQN